MTQLTCTVGTGSDHCSGLFGPGGSSSSATSTWEVKDSAGVLYDVALGFNVDVLPEPSTIVMVSVGVLGLVIARRRLARHHAPQDLASAWERRPGPTALTSAPIGPKR